MEAIATFVKIVKSVRRRTIGIRVNHDCTVRISVPSSLSKDKISSIITAKQSWINKKIAYFQNNKKPIAKPKLYIDGETLCYLGTDYKIKIVEAKKNYVEILENIIYIHKTKNSKTKNIITKWLNSLAKEVFTQRLLINFNIFSAKYHYHLPQLKIRKMKSRWGSMSSLGVMTLNSHLISTPIICLDYVIMHELCHLKHRNHSKRFYSLQQEFVPNYRMIKKQLESFSLNTTSHL
jgi:predicted metal-dependent hydrolase